MMVVLVQALKYGAVMGYIISRPALIPITYNSEKFMISVK